MNTIQELRKELNDIIVNQVKPLREKLDELLKNEAKRLCPFNIDDIITLENDKKGKITEIDYYSLDYKLNDNLIDNEFSLYQKNDEVYEVYAYTIDNKDFSITWKISGFRMIRNNSEVGKVPFRDISPVYYTIDAKSKTVTRKPLSAYIDNSDFLKLFDEIK